MLYIYFFTKCPGFLVRKVGLEIKDWIIELVIENCNLSSSKIVMGDLEKGKGPRSFILPKKTIYNAMKKDEKAHLMCIKKIYFPRKIQTLHQRSQKSI